MREKECCVNCGIANVPLYLGLDGNLHCADHAGMLIVEKKKEEQGEVKANGECEKVCRCTNCDRSIICDLPARGSD